MRLPRDVSASQIVKALGKLGYRTTRQTGSHIRLTTDENGQHHVTIPNHSPLRIGTLSAIVEEVASHFGVTRDQMVERLFGN